MKNPSSSSFNLYPSWHCGLSCLSSRCCCSVRTSISYCSCPATPRVIYLSCITTCGTCPLGITHVLLSHHQPVPSISDSNCLSIYLSTYPTQSISYLHILSAFNLSSCISISFTSFLSCFIFYLGISLAVYLFYLSIYSRFILDFQPAGASSC